MVGVGVCDLQVGGDKAVRAGKPADPTFLPLPQWIFTRPEQMCIDKFKVYVYRFVGSQQVYMWLRVRISDCFV